MTKLLRQLFFLIVVRPVVLIVLGLNVRHRERLPKAGPALIVANHNSHLDTLVLMTLFPPRLLDRLRPAAAMDYFLRNRLLAWFAQNIIGIIPVVRKRDSKEARSERQRATGIDEKEARSATRVSPEASPSAGSGATGTNEKEARSAAGATGTSEKEARSERQRATGTNEEEPRSERQRATGTEETTTDPLAGCHAVLDRGGIVIFFPEGSRGEPEQRSAFRSGIYFLAGRHPTAAIVPVFLHGLGKALPRGEILLVPFFVDVFVGEPLTIARDDKETFMAELDRRMQALAAEGQFPPWE
jgi:1-acyl-sn-glycerol-3-phosphate acyltransferase